MTVPEVCVDDNGGCSHFCIPTPNGARCACPDDPQTGAVVPIDGFNCHSKATKGLFA